MHSNLWQVDSWQNYKVTNLPFFNGNANLCNNIIKQPVFNGGIVNVNAINQLLHNLANVISNNGFILQMGDCAETFSQANITDITQRINFINTTSQLITKKNVIKIGRLAGQYAKPRNTLTTTHNNVTINNYFGDIFNDFNVNNRALNPNNMVTAFNQASFTYNVIQQLDNTINTSHEALNLFYEQAQTKNINGKYYNLSAHTLWLGDKTRFLGSAHIEYLRGIQNPIGIKLSNNISPQDFIKICQLINPTNTLGKIVVICRLGLALTNNLLPTYIKALQNSNINVLYMLDPMHGNNKIVEGIKTRFTTDITQELTDFAQVLKQCNQYFAGIHLESTPNNVKECNINITNYNKNYYQTTCDPRLNPNQTQQVITLLNTLL